MPEDRQLGPINRYIRQNSLGFIAIFIALSGSAYAVSANSVGTKELKRNAVGAQQIKKNAVRANKIQRNSVRPRQLAPNAVRPGHIRNNAVRTPKIQDGAVTAEKLAPGAVPDASIEDGSITTPKLADNSVSSEKLQALSVGSDQIDPTQVQQRIDAGCPSGTFIQSVIVDGDVQCASAVAAGGGGLTDSTAGPNRTLSIADGGVTNARIASWAVTSAKLGDSSVSNAKIQAFAVTTDKILNGAVTEGKIAPQAVTNEKLAVVTKRTENVGVTNGTANSVTAECNSGEMAIGGGARWTGGLDAQLHLIRSSTADTGQGWTAAGVNNTGASPRVLVAEVLCLA